jgi:hypothetical protein
MRAMGDLLPQPHPPHRTRSLAPREYSAHLFFSRVFCASGYLLAIHPTLKTMQQHISISMRGAL